ncbi:YdgA family protein [Legionella fairfieldensis]|uniref:YdgA family protein n=1 Tax=Legionella fairfieldensis TaxID=45064 RepID=UPI00048EE240|nr:YdgA family protein [Legionella fairfieldensis]
MKKFMGLVGVVAALVLCAYFGMGYLTEKKVRENLNIVNQSNGISASVEQYQRGWLTSDAILNWRLHIPEHTVSSTGVTVPAQDHQLRMPVKIYHGPIIFADKSIKFGLGYAYTHVPLPPRWSEQFNQFFSPDSTQPKLDLSMFVSYLNNTNVDATVPAFKILAKQGGSEFNWLGLTSSTTISSNLNKINGNITIDGLTFVKEPLKTTMSMVTSEYNLHRKNEYGLYLGDASLSFPSLTVMSGDKKLFELGQFDIQSDTNIEEGLFSSHFKTSLEKLLTNDKTYGPGHLEVAIRNLDAAVLVKINEQVNQLQQGTDAERQQALLTMLPELPKLFSKGAEFEVPEVNVVLPEGTIEGNLLISLPKADVGNPFELLQKIQGNGKLKVPASVVKNVLTESIKQKLLAPPPPQTIQQGIVQQMQQQQTNQAVVSGATVNSAPTTAVVNVAEVMQQAATEADKQLASMVESGILSLQGSDYVVEMSLNQGQLTVNGKPFSPAMLNFNRQ